MLQESPRNATLELELKAMMEKLKVFEPSRNAPKGQISDFFTDIAHLTKKMLQFYGRSQAIQVITKIVSLQKVLAHVIPQDFLINKKLSYNWLKYFAYVACFIYIALSFWHAQK